MIASRLVVCLSVLAFLLPARTVPAQTTEAPSVEDVPAQIVALLADYARAFKDHDAALLNATVGEELIEGERAALEAARDVTFASFEITPFTQYSGDLASKRIKDRYRGKQVATYHVVEESRIGAETDTYEEDGAFTFLREEGRGGYDGWRLVSKSDLDVLGFFSPYHLWDEDKVSIVKSERFILLTHPSTVDVLRPVLDVAEEAYDRMAAFWPQEQDDRYVIIAPSTTAELGRILHETVDLGKFVAFVAAGADRSTGWEPTGPRMFVHLSHLTNYGRAGQLEIIAHELIHAVTREVSGPQIPTWVEEGLANFGGGEGGRPSRASIGPTPDTFPSNDRFVTGPVQGIQAVYDQAQVAIETLDSVKGRREVAEFYIELGSRRVVPGTHEYHVRDAIARSTGWSMEAWVDAWRKRLG
jgi:hypothetical protein